MARNECIPFNGSSYQLIAYKGPFANITAVNLKYTRGESGDFAFVQDKEAFVYWNVELKTWKYLGVNKSDLVNNLNSDDVTKALAAPQGKELKGLIDALNVLITNEVTARENADTSLQDQIDGLHGGIYDGITFDASAPTPGKTCEVEFISSGVYPAWLTPTSPVTENVQVGDRVLIKFTAPNTYEYKYVPTSISLVQTLSGNETGKAASVAALNNVNSRLSNNEIFKTNSEKLHFKLYDIVGIFPNTEDYEIGISHAGYLSDDEYILIAFTKNGESFVSDNTKLLCRIYLPITGLVDKLTWLDTVEFNNSGVKIKVLVNPFDLINSLSREVNCILDKNYFSKKVEAKYIRSNGYKFGSISSCIKNIEFYTGDTHINNKITISQFGYDNNTGYFIIRLYDNTLSSEISYITKHFNSKPIGCEEIKGYLVNGNPIKLIIDFSKYFDIYQINTVTDIEIFPQKIINVNSISCSDGYDDSVSRNLIDYIDRNSVLTGEFSLDDTVTLINGKSLIGKNCTVLCNNPNASITIDDNCSISGIRFVSAKNARVLDTTPDHYTFIPNVIQSNIDNIATYLNGIPLINLSGKNSSIINCTFTNINRTSIKLGNTNDRILPKNCIISGNYFDNCLCAIYNSGEFNRFIGNLIHGCEIGAYMLGGNYSMSSNVFKMSDIALFIDDNGNGSHSEISAMQIAHCGIYGLYIKSLPRVLGLVIGTSHFADAPIKGIDCNSLLITGSRLDTWIELGTGGINSFIANIIRNAYAERDGKALFSGTNINLKNNIAMVEGIEDEINN